MCEREEPLLRAQLARPLSLVANAITSRDSRQMSKGVASAVGRRACSTLNRPRRPHGCFARRPIAQWPMVGRQPGRPRTSAFWGSDSPSRRCPSSSDPAVVAAPPSACARRSRSRSLAGRLSMLARSVGCSTPRSARGDWYLPRRRSARTSSSTWLFPSRCGVAVESRLSSVTGRHRPGQEVADEPGALCPRSSRLVAAGRNMGGSPDAPAARRA